MATAGRKRRLRVVTVIVVLSLAVLGTRASAQPYDLPIHQTPSDFVQDGLELEGDNVVWTERTGDWSGRVVTATEGGQPRVLFPDAGLQGLVPLRVAAATGRVGVLA